MPAKLRIHTRKWTGRLTVDDLDYLRATGHNVDEVVRTLMAAYVARLRAQAGVR